MEITLFGKQFFINKVMLFCGIIFLIVGAGVLGYFLKQVYQPMSSLDTEKSNTQIIQAKVSQPSEEMSKQEEEPEIKVYVIGCVNKPGVVTIKKGQVIDDVIKLVGGATKEADLENINLAYKLNENTMLRIKSKVINTVSSGTSTKASSAKTSPNKTAVAGLSSNSSKTNKTQKQNNLSATQADSSKAEISSEMNSGVDIVTDSLGAVVMEVDEDNGNSNSKKSSLININKASQAELENLPNVGPATAKAIIAYREKSDGFKKITDIMKITGIKQKTYDKIKEFICIE